MPEHARREAFPPVRPGGVLREEFMAPHGLSPYSLAVELGVDLGATETRGLVAVQLARLACRVR